MEQPLCLLEERRLAYDVSCTKFLGVILDNKLSWNSHVNNLRNIISKKYLYTQDFKLFVSECYKITLPFPYFFSLKLLLHDTGLLINKENKLNAFTCYKTRTLISHSHYLCPSAGLFSHMKILPVQDIVSLQTGIFMHNCYNGLLPTSLQDYFNLNANIHSYNTRNNHDFHPSLLRTERSKESIFNQGHMLWNKLPSNLKSKSWKPFRMNYKRLLYGIPKPFYIIL